MSFYTPEQIKNFSDKMKAYWQRSKEDGTAPSSEEMSRRRMIGVAKKRSTSSST